MAHGLNASSKRNLEYGSKNQPGFWMVGGKFSKRETVRFRRRLSKKIIKIDLDDYFSSDGDCSSDG